MSNTPQPRIMMAEIIGEPRTNATGPYGPEVMVKAVITQEGVHNGAYKNAEEIAKMARFGNHRWVCDSHPWTILVASPADIKGYQDNVQIEKVTMKKNDLTMDVPRVTADLHVVEEWAPELFKDVSEKKRKAVSIGYWAQILEEEGDFMGDHYTELEKEMVQDHTGILRQDEKPACEFALINNALKTMIKQRVAGIKSALGGQGGVDMGDPIIETDKQEKPPKPAEAAEQPGGATGGLTEAASAQEMAKRITELEKRDKANTELLARLKAEKDAEEKAKVKELAKELANITGQKPEVFENMGLEEITSHLGTAQNARVTIHNEFRGAGAANLSGKGAEPASNGLTWDPVKKAWF
jgi:hypothetical protein